MKNGNDPNPYCKCYLFPDEHKSTKRKGKTIMNLINLYHDNGSMPLSKVFYNYNNLNHYYEITIENNFGKITIPIHIHSTWKIIKVKIDNFFNNSLTICFICNSEIANIHCKQCVEKFC